MASNVFKPACSVTLYPDVCVSTLLSHPEILIHRASTKDLAIIAMEITLDEVQRTSALVSDQISGIDQCDRAAIEDCVELLGYTLHQLNESLLNLADKIMFEVGDVQTWLSASLTNQEMCIGALEGLNQSVKSPLLDQVLHISKLLSNSLAIVKSMSGSDQNDKGKQRSSLVNNRRLLIDFKPRGRGAPFDVEFFSSYGSIEDGFPAWLSSADRRLLQATPGSVKANVVVAQDGSGNYRTISEAVKAAPSKSSGRFIIHVKAGRYAEEVVVSKENVMVIGDGKDVTVVTGSKSARGGSSIFIATFAATGKGFIGRDITFENTAGPQNGQAVALRVGGDCSTLYRCSMRGYQDTLLALSQRQFYRDCDIYGTVDFIFGNAAAVFQSCNIMPRKPMMSGQPNFITAQGRTDPNQNTGFSIHNCRIIPASDLRPVKSSYNTYLGRPWKQYSRTVYMQSYLDAFIHPGGWKEWSGSFALNTLYYGEYMNSGPGSATSQRVKWPGYRVITSAAEANKFTVAQFISGNSWLPSTGVAFQAGLIG